MISPVVKGQRLERVLLEPGLTAYRCSVSKGVYIPVGAYFRWLAQQSERLPHLPKAEIGAQKVVDDDSRVKICPESGQIMQRFAVGHGFTFYIDRSPTGSIWLDGGEWETLRARNFHDELHLVFTAPWQDQVRYARSAEVHRELLIERLGSELFAKVEQLRIELLAHEQRDIALAHLQNSKAGE